MAARSSTPSRGLEARALRRDRHDRPDTWFVLPDVANLAEVMGDALRAIREDGFGGSKVPAPPTTPKASRTRQCAGMLPERNALLVFWKTESCGRELLRGERCRAL